jgi:hypothetical protein
VVLEGPRDLLGGNTLAARLNDQQGFGECHIFDLKSKARPEFWDSLTKGGTVEFQRVPIPYALRLLEEAHQVDPLKDGAASYAAHRERLLTYWGEGPPDLDRLLGDITPGERSRLLEESRKLAQDRLFYFWIPAAEEIAPWYDKLKAILESRLVITDQQKQGRIDDLVNEATRALYPQETRPQWRRRLRDMAYYLALQGRKEEARAAAAAADDLIVERSHLLGDAAFLKTLTTLALRLTWEMEEGAEKGQKSPLSLLAPPSEPLILRR